MKRLLLTVISTLSFLLLLVFGHYRKWFLDTPLYYWNAFCKEVSHPASQEEIKRGRYGQPYILSLKVRAAAEAGQFHDPIFLFEPNDFFRDSLHMDLRMPEPAVFYYYTGLQGVWMNSPTVQKANYFVMIRKGDVKVEPIRSLQQLQEILSRYKSFTPTL